MVVKTAGGSVEAYKAASRDSLIAGINPFSACSSDLVLSKGMILVEYHHQMLGVGQELPEDENSPNMLCSVHSVLC